MFYISSCYYFLIAYTLKCVLLTSFYVVTVRRGYLKMVLMLWDVLTVQMSTKLSLVHYPHPNASGVNTLTTIAVTGIFIVRDVLQDITVQQGMNSPLSKVVHNHKLAQYLVHWRYPVLHPVRLHARAPAPHNVPMVLGNSHLARDVMLVKQVHIKTV